MNRLRALALVTASTLLAAGLTSCKNSVSSSKMTITQTPFGSTKGGQSATLFTLTNGTGAQVKISNYGGVITQVLVPDKKGQLEDVVLGFDTLRDYENDSPYFGCITGRYANRIAKGRFAIDGQNYQLAVNNGPNHLHGGKVGFDKVVWSAQPLQSSREVGIELTYTSPDGDESFPGALATSVRYTWNDDNELRIHYRATTTKPTVVNLTNHSYFNLAGHNKGNILNHELTLECDSFTPTNAVAIPTGEIRAVTGTPFDFTAPHAIGERINAADQQIQFGGGYDHNFIVNGSAGRLRKAALVIDHGSGRTLDVLTTEPGIQLYTGNFLSGVKGKNGATYAKRNGFCLETQHYPDSPNQPSFPSTLLAPGETYDSTTVYRFGVRK